MATFPTIQQISGNNSLGELVVFINQNFAAVNEAAQTSSFGYVRPTIIVENENDSGDIIQASGDWALKQTSTIANADAAFISPSQLLQYGSILQQSDIGYATSIRTTAGNVDADGNVALGLQESTISTQYGLVALSQESTVSLAYSGQLSADTPIALHPLSLHAAFNLWKALEIDQASTYSTSTINGTLGTVSLADSLELFAQAAIIDDQDFFPIAASPRGVRRYLSSGTNFNINTIGSIASTSMQTSSATIESLTASTINAATLNIDSYEFEQVSSLQLSSLAGNIQSLYTGGDNSVSVAQKLEYLLANNGFNSIVLSGVDGSMTTVAAAYATRNSKILTLTSDDNIIIQAANSNNIIDEEIGDEVLKRVDNSIKITMNPLGKNRMVATKVFETDVASGSSIDMPANFSYLVCGYNNDNSYLQLETSLQLFLNGLLLTPGIDYYEDVSKYGQLASSIVILKDIAIGARLTVFSNLTRQDTFNI